MSALTAGQKTNLRDDHPHKSKYYLSPVPTVELLQALVNDLTIDVGEFSVVYDTGTGTAGEYALISEGMTLILGSSAGEDDLGRGRIKSISGNQVSGTITMAWNSDILWENNAYITILFLWEPWPRFPRFTVSPDAFFKDYDITYASQGDPNEDQHPVAIMGTAWAGWLVSGTVVVTLHGGNSYTIANGATIPTYAWTVSHNIAGATPIIAAAANANTTITLDAPGLYWVRLTITDSNGQTTYITKPFIAHDSTSLPFRVESASRTASEASLSVQLAFTLSGAVSESDIPKKTPLIFWSENMYNTTAVDVSYLNTDEYEDRTHINFFGYLMEESASIDEVGKGSVSMTAFTANEYLRAKYLYPVAVIAKSEVTGPIDEWWKFPNNQLTTRRALHHLFYWHSNIHNICDIYYPSDSRLMVSAKEFSKGSLLGRAAEFSRGRIFAYPVSDIYGGIHVEISIQMLDTADRAAITDTLTLASTDWRGPLNINLRDTRPIAFASTNASNWDGTTFNAYCSRWGEIATNEGVGVIDAPNLVVDDQAHLNMILGRLVALENHNIREINMTMAGNWSSAIGVYPQQWARLSLSGSEAGNHRGIVLTNIRVRPIQISTSFELKGLSKTSVTWQPEALGRDGETISCSSPDTDIDPPSPDSAGGTPGAKRIYVGTTDKGMFVIESGSVTQKNSGLSGSYLNFVSFDVNPVYIDLRSEKHVIIGATDGGFVYTLDGAENWSVLASASLPNPTNTAGDPSPPTSSDLDEVGVAFDPQNVNRWYLVRVTDSTWNATKDPRVYLYWTEDTGTTWTSFGVGV